MGTCLWAGKCWSRCKTGAGSVEQGALVGYSASQVCRAMCTGRPVEEPAEKVQRAGRPSDNTGNMYKYTCMNMQGMKRGRIVQASQAWAKIMQPSTPTKETQARHRMDRVQCKT